MAWDVEVTDEFASWYGRLVERALITAVNAAVDELVQRGPALRRQLVGEVSGSTIHNLKELRVGSVRILFVFDPRRTAILLLGGDKSGAWNAWYQHAIPEAERLYGEYLRELHDNGILA